MRRLILVALSATALILGTLPAGASAAEPAPGEQAGGRAAYKIGGWGSHFYSLDRPPQDAQPARSILAGWGFSMSIRTDGVPVVWGDMPGAPLDAGPIRRAAVSGQHVVAIKRNRTVISWGSDDSQAMNVPPRLTDVAAVGTGAQHSIALRRNGTVVAWGRYQGRCNNSNNCINTPAAAPAGLTGVVAITSGSEHSLALRRNGTVVAWGGKDNSAAVVPSGLKNVVAVAAGGQRVEDPPGAEYPDYVAQDFSAALLRDGSVVTWGNGLPRCSLGRVRSIAAGSNHLVAVGRNGRIRSCGKLSQQPPRVRDAIAVAAGQWHALALRKNGKVVAWGDNLFGETVIPVRPRNVVAVASGEYFSLALTRTGQVMAWGAHQFGQTSVPRGLRDVRSVAAGGHTGYAIRNDGTVAAWGWNGEGQTDVPHGLKDVVAIAAGPQHALALKRDGSVDGWGARCDTDGNCPNAHGAEAVPPGLTDVKAIAAGGAHSVALKKDGTAVAWGNNDNGQTYVNGQTGIAGIAAGIDFTLVVQDGYLVPWGGAPQKIWHGSGDVTAVVASGYQAAITLADGTVKDFPLIEEPRVLPYKNVRAVSVGPYHGALLYEPRKSPSGP